MPAVRFFFFLIFVSAVLPLFAQADSSRQGTIKIVKNKKKDLYVRAEARFDLTRKNDFQPFPLVEGHAFPFNYSRFFQDNFKEKNIVSEGEVDTIYVEVRITKKGKAIIKDGTPLRLKNIPPARKKHLDKLYQECFVALASISKWYPAYSVNEEVGKFKGTTVIRPVKKDYETTGVITVYFYSEPFLD
jgi:hypothetical protein